MVRLLQSLLMAPGPFYFYPWKAVVNATSGDDYDVGFKHFVQGHRNAVNLALHSACLFIQVFGNFALLNALDQRVVPQPVQGVRMLSAVSAGTWAAYLLAAAPSCPLVAKVGSAAVLALAYFIAPLITPRLMDQGAALGFVLTLLISNFGLTKKPIDVKALVRLLIVMALWATAWPHLEGAFVKYALGGTLAATQTTAVIGAVAAYLGVLASMKNPLTLVVLTGVAVTRLASAALGGDSILFFWSYAFTGSLFQGLTHRAVKEEATLLSLERETEERKLKFEWSHVTFFPNLLLHAVVNAIRGTGSRAAASKQ